MTRTISDTVAAITEAARERHGELPPGWEISHLYRDSPYLIVLDCGECNSTVARWQVEESRLGSFGREVLRATGQHQHWARWEARQ